MSSPHTPHIERFSGLIVAFHRGLGTDVAPVRQCFAYWREGDDDALELIAVHDPSVGIDPEQCPPETTHWEGA